MSQSKRSVGESLCVGPLSRPPRPVCWRHITVISLKGGLGFYTEQPLPASSSSSTVQIGMPSTVDLEPSTIVYTTQATSLLD